MSRSKILVWEKQNCFRLKRFSSDLQWKKTMRTIVRKIYLLNVKKFLPYKSVMKKKIKMKSEYFDISYLHTLKFMLILSKIHDILFLKNLWHSLYKIHAHFLFIIHTHFFFWNSCSLSLYSSRHFLSLSLGTFFFSIIQYTFSL